MAHVINMYEVVTEASSFTSNSIFFTLDGMSQCYQMIKHSLNQ